MSDSDDDDLLNSAPTFKKRTRRSDINEKKTFNFLDEMLEEERKKTERQKRIVSLLKDEENGGDCPNHCVKKMKQEPIRVEMSTGSKYDINDPLYWQRIKAMSKSSGLHERDKRRRAIEDALDGLDDVERSGEKDTEENRRKRAKMRNAIQNGRSSHVGTRKVIFGENALKTELSYEDWNISSFSSEDKALIGLDNVIKKIYKRSLTREGTNKQIHGRGIVKAMEDAKEANLLALHLERRSFTEKEVVPFSVIQWLIQTAVSGSKVGIPLCLGAFNLVIKAMKKNVYLYEGAFCSAKEGDNAQRSIFHLNDFSKMLQNEFGFRIGQSPPNFKSTAGMEKNSILEPQLNNVVGLSQMLEIWAVALENGYVQWDDLDSVAGKNTSGKFIAMLTRCSLDPVFHSSGFNLLTGRNNVYSSFFSHIRQIHTIQRHDCCDGFTPFLLGLIRLYAETTYTACSNLSAGGPNSQDADDEEGWLPLALAAKGCHHVESSRPGSKLLTLFFGLLSSHSAKQCLSEFSQSWGNEVKACKMCFEAINEEAFGYHILACSEAAFQIINQAGPGLTDDGPRFLAAVDMASCSSQMGMVLICSNSNEQKDFFDKTIAVEIVCNYYKRMEGLCNQLKKKVTSVVADSHMRRVKASLSYLSVFYNHCCTMTKSMAGIREFNEQQSNIESWIFNEGKKKPSDEYSSDEDCL